MKSSFKFWGTLSALLMLSNHAQAEQKYVTDGAGYTINMNIDGTPGEGLYLRDGPVGQSIGLGPGDDCVFAADCTWQTFAEIHNTYAAFSGEILDFNDDTVNIGEKLDVAMLTTLVATNITGAANINDSGSDATTIGANGNTTNLLSSTINIGTGAYQTTIAVGNTDDATTASLTAGSTSLNLANGSLSSEVNTTNTTGNIHISSGTQFYADANGKILDTGDGEGDAVTAALVVKNENDNIHGIVVEEDSTTMSGGYNSSSLKLSDGGANFSNALNGAPIIVGGVADGIDDFDAVNVRQLHGGLASIMASSPELQLSPGKMGFGVGVGRYGDATAYGVGIGFMTEGGMTFSTSYSKAQYGEPAIKGSVSWTW